MHPHLDLFDQILRIIGWPSLLGVLVWAIRTYDKGQRQLSDIDLNAKLAAQTAAVVQQDVITIRTNHLEHLQQGITRLAASNDEAVTALQNIDKGIAILVDRDKRA